MIMFKVTNNQGMTYHSHEKMDTLCVDKRHPCRAVTSQKA